MPRADAGLEALVAEVVDLQARAYRQGLETAEKMVAVWIDSGELNDSQMVLANSLLQAFHKAATHASS